jgi:Zn-dependent M16 (insulinase) family peptidase
MLISEFFCYSAEMTEKKQGAAGNGGETISLRVTPKANELWENLKPRTGGIPKSQFFQQLLSWFASKEDSEIDKALSEMRKFWAPAVGGHNYERKRNGGKKRRPRIEDA